MRKFTVLAFVANLFLAYSVFAQSWTPIVFHAGATADADGEELEVSHYSTVGVQIAGTFTATVNFEVRPRDSATWSSLLCTNTVDASQGTSSSSAATWQCPTAGFYKFRARVSDHSSGTVVVIGHGTVAVSKAGGGGSGGPGGLDAEFDISGGNKITGSSESKRFEVCDTGGTNCFAAYWHSSGKLVITCIVAGVENACDKVVELAAGKFYQVKNSGGNVILEVDEATGNMALRIPKHFAVATCQGSTASLIFDTPTSNAPAAVCEGTNRRMATADFDDTTDESFYDTLTLPPIFKGTIIAHFTWKGANTTNAVGWCMQLVRVPDGATSDPAFPAQASGNCVSDTAKGTTLQENAATIVGVTCTSCVANDRVNIAISRDANGSAVTDSFVGDGKLITYGYTIF